MSSLIKSAGVVALSTLCSRILGLARDVLMAAYFGAARTADVFFIAFMIPNLFRRLVAEGALTISFIPVYTETLINKGEDEAGDLASKVMTVQGFAVIIIITLGVIFAPQFMYFFFGRGDIPGILNLSINLTRIMFPYLFFAGFVAFAMGYLNSRGRFFAPAFAPVLLNIGMISGILFLTKLFDEPVYGAAAGVIIGGLLQLGIQIPYMVREGFRFRVSLDFKHPGIRKIFRMLTPALFGISVYQINTVVCNMMATTISEGSVSYIFYTNRLTELVLGVFIVSIGNVVLPEMSKLTAMDDSTKFRKLFSTSLSSAMFLAVPATAGLITAGIPIISVIFMHGKFTYSDVLLTYNSLVCASSGIVFIAILRIATPAFYSMKDTGTPVLSASVALIINLVLGYILMKTPMKHAGLALANTVSALVQMLILMTRLEQKTGGLDISGIAKSFLKFCASAILMSLIVLWLSSLKDWSMVRTMEGIIHLVITVIAGIAVYFSACYLMRTEELLFFINRIKRRLT